MRITPLLALRSWAARLHSPIQTSSSRKLLAVLQTSFQQDLDEVHPPIRSREAQASDLRATPGPNLDNVSALAAHGHLDSVLRHPLLAEQRGNAQGVLSRETGLEMAARMFDTAVLEQRMDIPTLRSCLQTGCPSMEKYLSVSNTTAQARLGPRIAAWFTFTDPKTKQQFLTHPILEQVVPVMWRDGHEATVWEWLRILYERDFGLETSGSEYSPSRGKWLRSEQFLVHLMIREAIRLDNIASAIEQYCQACRYMLRSGRMRTRSDHGWADATALHGFVPLRRTYKFIVSIILYTRRGLGLAAENYDQLLKYSPSPQSCSVVGPHTLRLYHPLKPDALEFYSWLNLDTFQSMQLPQILAGSPQTQKLLVSHILDAARLFLKQNDLSKAKGLLNMSEEYFPSLISSRTSESKLRTEAAPNTFVPASFAF